MLQRKFFVLIIRGGPFWCVLPIWRRCHSAQSLQRLERLLLVACLDCSALEGRTHVPASREHELVKCPAVGSCMYLQSCYLGQTPWRDLYLVAARCKRQPEIGRVGDEACRLAVDQYPEWLCVGSEGATPVQVNSAPLRLGRTRRCKGRALGTRAYTEYK